MSDLALYRLSEGYCLRIHGSEHFITEEELGQLADFLNSVADGGPDRFGTEYSELAFAAEQRSKNKLAATRPDLSRLFAHLKPQPAPIIKRRF